MSVETIQASPQLIAKIKKSLRQKKWSQTYLAGKINRSRGTIHNALNGRNVQIETLVDICFSLDIQLKDYVPEKNIFNPPKSEDINQENQENNTNSFNSRNSRDEYGLTRLTEIEEDEFKNLCFDLLVAENFDVRKTYKKSNSTSEIYAVEEFLSHDARRSVHVNWKVRIFYRKQSDSIIGTQEIEELFTGFAVNKQNEEGYFIISNVDFSEECSKTLGEYLKDNKTFKVNLWNPRHLISKLKRHPNIIKKYHLSFSISNFVGILSTLSKFHPCRVLIISDHSSFSHNLTLALRNVGFEITLISFWNYDQTLYWKLFEDSFDSVHWDLIIFFTGNSYRYKIPTAISDFVLNAHRRGTSLLLFPFLAWLIHHGYYPELNEILPVDLVNPISSSLKENQELVVGKYRFGDFRWLIQFDSFAEDRYVELDPRKTKSSLSEGIETSFGLLHSFEFLQLRKNSDSVWNDTTGNPFVITNISNAAKVCYVNSCCHSCMSPIPVLSPLEVSDGFSILLRNILEWLLDA